MSDEIGKSGSEAGPEADAVNKRFHDLESQLESLRAAAHCTDRRGFFKGITLGLMFALGLLFFIGVLYAQNGGDALFIDPRGWIGIGTNKPNAMLDVAGTLNVANNTILADAGIKGSLTVGGNVGIGTAAAPSAKLAVNGRIKDQTGFVMPVGSILAYYGAKAPDGWLLCDGGVIANDDKYQELKTLLGKSNTPDLRGRTLVGTGQGAGLAARALGQQGGEENHQLSIAEMPSHNHYGFGEGYNNYWPLGQVGRNNNKGSRGGVDEDNYYYNTSSTGGSTPFNNMQPYHVANYIIKY
jgi:microcystin-dependent protein